MTRALDRLGWVPSIGTRLRRPYMYTEYCYATVVDRAPDVGWILVKVEGHQEPRNFHWRAAIQHGWEIDPDQ